MHDLNQMLQCHVTHVTGQYVYIFQFFSFHSSVSIVTRLRAARPEFDSRQDRNVFLFAAVSISVLWTTLPPIQWVPGALAPGGKAIGA
jgi:hypothetical protein